MPGTRYESEREGGRGRYGYSGRGGGRWGEEEEYGSSRHGRTRHESIEEEREHRMRGQAARSERAARAPHDERGYAEDMGQGGWFGDPEGHSEASGRGWENPEHRPSGWFGDPEGHSRASRKGWGEEVEEEGDGRSRRARPHYEEEGGYGGGGRGYGSRSRHDRGGGWEEE
ncbi:MAG: hypothetical protein PHW76_01825 [Alphaproteobacteria bacterium]|nr:hypothetical protein [Alphaproteobacteria bacterium]